MANREVEAVLKISAKTGNMRPLTDINAKMQQIDRSARAFNRTQTLMARTSAATARVMGPMMKVMAPLAGAYGLQRSVGVFASVERQLTRIGLTLNASKEDMAGLYGDVNRYSKAYALGSDKVLETVGAYAAAGAEISDIRNDLGLLTKAQQALDATGIDTVNSWDTARKSLGLTTKDAEKFFEIMAAGSSVGKFEANNMAESLPSLLPSASKQGFRGTEGAQRLVGFLEVMADYTGTAGAAATAVGDFLEKISSPDVEKRLGKISGRFAKDIKSARDNGGDMLETMHKVLKEATKGDASKLGAIFGDKEARAAATVILTKMDQIREAQRGIAANAPGILDRNNKALLEDTQAGLDRMKETLGQLAISGGKFAASLGAPDGLNYLSDRIDYASQVNDGLEKSGVNGFVERTIWGLTHTQEEKDAMARIGGRRTEDEIRQLAVNEEYSKSRRAAVNREPTYGFKIDANGIPVPVSQVDNFADRFDASMALQNRENAEFEKRRSEKSAAAAIPPQGRPAPSFREAEVASMSSYRKDYSQISDAIEDASARGAQEFGPPLIDASGPAGEALGTTAASAIALQADGIGARIGAAFGAAIAPYIASATANLMRPIGSLGVSDSGNSTGVSGNPGRSMPNAGVAGAPR